MKEAQSLKTQRLLLRPLAPQDLDGMLALHSDPEVMFGRTGARIPESPEEVEAYLDRAVALPHRDGLGIFRIADVATGDFVGRAGLRPEAETGLPEITYAIRRDLWGIGLGTEVAQALWRHAARSGITHLLGDVLPGNRASRRILTGLGMRIIGQQRHSDGAIVLRFEGTPAAK